MGVLVVSLLARVSLLLNIRGLSHVFMGLPLEVRPTHSFVMLAVTRQLILIVVSFQFVS